MSVKVHVYDGDDGQPAVVMVTTGAFDVARLAGLLNSGRCEDKALAAKVTAGLRRHSGGRAALATLRAHGGPGLLEDVHATAAGLDRETLGKIVRGVWVAWAHEQPGRKPSWVLDWDDLDDGQREVDMRIGEMVAGLFSPERMLRAMHSVFGLHDGWLPAAPTAGLPDGLRSARWKLISEEVDIELYNAMIAGDLVKIADAIADAVCALVGTAICYGLPFDWLFAEVMRSNLTKTSVPGQPKLVKGPGYDPPHLAGILGIETAARD